MAAESYTLPVPEIQAFDDMFRVNLFRSVSEVRIQENIGQVSECQERHSYGSSVKGSVKCGENAVKFGENALSDTKNIILTLLEENNRSSAAVLAERLSVSVRTVEKNIRELREAGILVRHGSARGGYWEIRRLDVEKKP